MADLLHALPVRRPTKTYQYANLGPGDVPEIPAKSYSTSIEPPDETEPRATSTNCAKMALTSEISTAGHASVERASRGIEARPEVSEGKREEYTRCARTRRATMLRPA